MTTHRAHSAAVRPAVPCAAWHVTFGGRCLNCGFDPAAPDATPCRPFRGPRYSVEYTGDATWAVVDTQAPHGAPSHVALTESRERARFLARFLEERPTP